MLPRAYVDDKEIYYICVLLLLTVIFICGRISKFINTVQRFATCGQTDRDIAKPTNAFCKFSSRTCLRSVTITCLHVLSNLSLITISGNAVIKQTVRFEEIISTIYCSGNALCIPRELVQILIGLLTALTGMSLFSSVCLFQVVP